jgi:hypothetical protein
MPAQTPRAQHAQSEPRHERRQHEQDMPEGASPGDLQGTVVLAEQPGETVHQWRGEAGQTDEQHAQ